MLSTAQEPARAQEESRLQALARYELLDTPSEPAYDRITALLARLFRAPAAGLSLVDESRQWFKSRQNLGLCETPREGGFCSSTIESDEVLVVPDALASPFRENLLVREGALRFYAGAPLRTSDGYRIGALWFSDPAPRPMLDPDEKQVLLDLAAVVMSEMDLRLATSRLAEARRHAALLERLAATGTLAAVVGHEINTPLAFLIANATLIAESLAREPISAEPLALMRECVKDVLAGAERIRQVSTSLRAVVGEPQGQLSAVDLCASLRRAADKLAPALASRVQIEHGVPPGTLARADAVRLEQVLLHLLHNAAEAMPEGKVGSVRAIAVQRGDAVILELRDDGRGMSSQVLARALDPFFTTKSIGAGVGLGLSFCHSAVRSFGGALSLESRESEGTLVRIQLSAPAPDAR